MYAKNVRMHTSEEDRKVETFCVYTVQFFLPLYHQGFGLLHLLCFTNVCIVSYTLRVRSEDNNYNKWKNLFFKMKRDVYRDGVNYEKGYQQL